MLSLSFLFFCSLLKDFIRKVKVKKRALFLNFSFEWDEFCSSLGIIFKRNPTFASMEFLKDPHLQYKELKELERNGKNEILAITIAIDILYLICRPAEQA